MSIYAYFHIVGDNVVNGRVKLQPTPQDTASLSDFLAFICKRVNLDQNKDVGRGDLTLYSTYFSDYGDVCNRVALKEELKDCPDFASYLLSKVRIGVADLYVVVAQAKIGPLKPIESGKVSRNFLLTNQPPKSTDQAFYFANASRLASTFCEYRDVKRDAVSYYRAAMFAVIEQQFFAIDSAQAFENLAEFITECNVYADGNEYLPRRLRDIAKALSAAADLTMAIQQELHKFIASMCVDPALDKAVVMASKNAMKRFLIAEGSKPMSSGLSGKDGISSSSSSSSSSRSPIITYNQCLLDIGGGKSLQEVVDHLFGPHESIPDPDFVRSGMLFTAINAKGSFVDICECDKKGEFVADFFDDCGAKCIGTVHLVRLYQPFHYGILYPTYREMDGQLLVDRGAYFNAVVPSGMVRSTGFGGVGDRGSKTGGGSFPSTPSKTSNSNNNSNSNSSNGYDYGLESPSNLNPRATTKAGGGTRSDNSSSSPSTSSSSPTHSSSSSSSSFALDPRVLDSKVQTAFQNIGLSQPDNRVIIRSYFHLISLFGGLCTYYTDFKNDAYLLGVRGISSGRLTETKFNIMQSLDDSVSAEKVSQNVLQRLLDGTPSAAEHARLVLFTSDGGANASSSSSPFHNLMLNNQHDGIPFSKDRFNGEYYKGDPIEQFELDVRRQGGRGGGGVAAYSYSTNRYSIEEVKEDLRDANSSHGIARNVLTVHVDGIKTVLVDANVLVGPASRAALYEYLRENLCFVVSFDASFILTKGQFIEKVLQSHEIFRDLDPTKYTVDDRTPPTNPFWSRNVTDGAVVTIKNSHVIVNVIDGFPKNAKAAVGLRKIALEMDAQSSLEDLIARCKDEFGVGQNKRFQIFANFYLDQQQHQQQQQERHLEPDEFAVMLMSAQDQGQQLEFRSKYCSVRHIACEVFDRDSRHNAFLVASYDVMNEDGQGHDERCFFYCDPCMNTFLTSQRKPRGTFFTHLVEPRPDTDVYRNLPATVPSLFETPILPREEDQHSRYRIQVVLIKDIPCPFRGAPDLLLETWINNNSIYSGDQYAIDQEFNRFNMIKPKTVCCMRETMYCESPDYRDTQGNANMIQLGCGHWFHKDCLAPSIRTDIDSELFTNLNSTKVAVCPECKNLNDTNPEMGICTDMFCCQPDQENIVNPGCHKFTQREFREIFSTLSEGLPLKPITLGRVEKYLEKYERVSLMKFLKNSPSPAGEEFLLCKCEQFGENVASHRSFFRCEFCNLDKCVKCLDDWHANMTCQQANVNKAKKISDDAGVLSRFCPRSGSGCMHFYSIPIACRHSTCTSPDCGVEFCYNCGVEYNSYLAHGLSYHYPECFFFKKCCDNDCCRKEEAAKVPANALGGGGGNGSAAGGGAGPANNASYSSHVGLNPGETKSRMACTGVDKPKFQPGPCADCFEVVGKHNSCTHTAFKCWDSFNCNKWAADPARATSTDKNGKKGYFCRHYCKQCHYLGQVCQPIKRPPACEVVPEDKIKAEEVKAQAEIQARIERESRK